MSYILEALRKADAERERERDSVPNLHAQLLPPGLNEAEVAPSRAPLLPWLGLGAALALGAAATWWALGRDEPPAQLSGTTSTPQAPVAPAVAPSLQRQAAPPTPQPLPDAAPSPATLTAAPSAPQAEPVPEPAAVTAPKPPAKARPAPAAKAAASPPRSAPSTAKVAVQAPQSVVAPSQAEAPAPAKAEPSAPPARVPALAELPPELRQQVPPLAIGGSVYSPQASARMVVVNGQVFQEGSSLAPELKLEQIRQKTAVFSIRGQRFEVPL
jgi:general secretion pathway protein B